MKYCGAAVAATYEQDPSLNDLNVLNEAKRLNEWNVLQVMEALLTHGRSTLQ
jgi:hypothetical protein